MLENMQSRLIQAMSKGPCNLCRESILPVSGFSDGRNNPAVRKVPGGFSG